MENLNKYHRGKVYAIRSHQTNKVYIGSSIDRLSRRLSKHKCDLKMYITGKHHYTASYEIVKYPDCYIELIEEVKYNNKMELTRREGQVIRETLNCVNRNVAGRTQTEYRRDNKEAILIQNKQYRQDNRETILTKKKRKYNCECGGKYTHVNKVKHSRTQRHQAYIATL